MPWISIPPGLIGWGRVASGRRPVNSVEAPLLKKESEKDAVLFRGPVNPGGMAVKSPLSWKPKTFEKLGLSCGPALPGFSGACDV